MWVLKKDKVLKAQTSLLFSASRPNNVAPPFSAGFGLQGSAPILLCFTPHSRLSQIQEPSKFPSRTIVTSFRWEFLQCGPKTSTKLFHQGKLKAQSILMYPCSDTTYEFVLFLFCNHFVMVYVLMNTRL